MTIIVTGLERSGTRWLTSLLARHPSRPTVIHTSIPECYMPRTRWPDFSGADAVVCIIRYEPFRLRSMEAVDFNRGRPQEFLPPTLYERVANMPFGRSQVITPFLYVGYESLLSPMGLVVFRKLLLDLGLDPITYANEDFDPVDANEKYLSEPTVIGTHLEQR